MTQPRQNHHWWHPLTKTLASNKAISALLSKTLHHADRLLIKLTGGKQTAATILTGVPMVTLTTTGAKSGKQRSIPIIAVPDGENLIFIASNWGQQTHPGWYYNMRANPRVQIEQNGTSAPYLAHEAQEEERERCWNLAVDAYVGYAAYESRTNGRIIPVMVCTPTS